MSPWSACSRDSSRRRASPCDSGRVREGRGEVREAKSGVREARGGVGEARGGVREAKGEVREARGEDCRGGDGESENRGP